MLQVRVLPVHTVDSHHVVAEVKGVKPLLLAEQCNDSTPRPLQPLPTPLSE